MARQTSKKVVKKDVEKLNETGRRSKVDRRKESLPVKTERRKVQRRRQIDPTTCERDYNLDEIEFMQALDDYKRANGRMFPTCSEILEVLQKLGYRKLSPEQLAETELPAEEVPTSEGDLESTPIPETTPIEASIATPTHSQ